MAGTVAPAFLQQFFTNAGAPAASHKLFVYLAGTTTKVNTYSEVTLTTANANPIVLDSAGRCAIFLSPGLSYKFVLATSADSDPPVSPIWTRDNVANIPPNAVNLDITGTLGELIAAAGKVMYLSDGSGGTIAGRWYKADASAVAKSVNANAIAVSLQDGASAASISLRLAGRIDGLSGLSVGTLYYIDASVPGDITATPPTNARPVAVADSATSIVLSNWVPTTDASATFAGRVTTGTQTIAGAKTFSGAMVASSTLGVTGLATFTVPPVFNPGTSASASGTVSGRVTTNTTPVANVGAGEDDLMTYSLAANSLSADGKVVRVVGWGTIANTAANKTIKGYFGATAVVATPAGFSNEALNWRAVLDIVRTGAATQVASGQILIDDGAHGAEVQVGAATPAETLSGAVTIKFTGEATNNNDITQSGMIVEVIG
jgi:hypothetical protein